MNEQTKTTKTYPHTVWIRFPNRSGAFGMTDEIQWRFQQQKELGKLLEDANVGFCDGGGSGMGCLDIYFFVSDIDKAVEILLNHLTDNELIAWCRYISSTLSLSGEWKTHYPDAP